MAYNLAPFYRNGMRKDLKNKSDELQAYLLVGKGNLKGSIRTARTYGAKRKKDLFKESIDHSLVMLSANLK